MNWSTAETAFLLFLVVALVVVLCDIYRYPEKADRESGPSSEDPDKETRR